MFKFGLCSDALVLQCPVSHWLVSQYQRLFCWLCWEPQSGTHSFPTADVKPQHTECLIGGRDNLFFSLRLTSLPCTMRWCVVISALKTTTQLALPALSIRVSAIWGTLTVVSWEAWIRSEKGDKGVRHSPWYNLKRDPRVVQVTLTQTDGVMIWWWWSDRQVCLWWCRSTIKA